MKKRNLLMRIVRRAYILTDEYAILPFWGVVPRVIFGNNAGLLNNVLPQLELHHLQNKMTKSFAKDNVTANILKVEGMAQLGIIHERQLLAEIKHKAQQALNNPDLTVHAGHPPYQNAHIMLKNPAKTIPEFVRLLDENIQQIIEAYYGTYFKVTQLRCWRNSSVPEAASKLSVYSNQWHNDQFNTNELKFFVYLSDNVNRETGAFHAFKVPETQQIMRSFGYFRRSHIYATAKKLTEDTSKIQYVEGDTGTAFIANATRCLHRAGVPKQGSYRDIVQFCIQPSDKKLPTDWYRYLPQDSYKD